MDRTLLLQEVRLMRFEGIYNKWNKGCLSVEEAAEILGISDRSFRRWRNRFEEEGEEGLADRRIGKASEKAAPVDEVSLMLEVFDTHYADFTVKHFHEKWREEHSGNRSYTWTKNQLQKHGKVKKAKKKGAHRRKRPRKPMIGMMLLQDGSEHEWVSGELWDLIVTMDDATSEIYSAFFVEEEGTMSSFRGIREVIEAKGLFGSLYVDRASHYFYTPEVGGKVDKSRPTQVHRALKQLGIVLMPSYSPEARGRIERLFRTLQDRLVKELCLAGIKDMLSANRYLKERFIPAHNARFAVKPEEESSAFIPWVGSSLKDVLCVQEERVVGKDNTVSYQNKKLQIPADEYRYHYVKAQVRVHEYEDGSLAVYHGPRFLARYDASGTLVEKKQDKKKVVPA